VTDTTNTRPRDTFHLAYFGAILLVVGVVMSTTTLGLTGVIVGLLGVAMLTVWMLRRYR